MHPIVNKQKTKNRITHCLDRGGIRCLARSLRQHVDAFRNVTAGGVIKPRLPACKVSDCTQAAIDAGRFAGVGWSSCPLTLVSGELAIYPCFSSGEKNTMRMLSPMMPGRAESE
jgi:hypothetical protein